MFELKTIFLKCYHDISLAVTLSTDTALRLIYTASFHSNPGKKSWTDYSPPG